MKRFKIEYQINSEAVELYAESMDLHHRMFSLERKLMDPHPLLIEHIEDRWKVTSQDNWGLNEDEITNLGNLLEQEYDSRPQE